MVDLLLAPTALLYLLVVGLLFVFGVNFFYLTYLSLRRGGPERSQTPPPLEDWPAVSVQLPIYNELYVAERLIRAAASLDYPSERLEIQVLDDSTDETVEIVSRLVRRLHASGVDIVHLHRRDRTGYKAGALAAGTARAKGEFFAIFDADFLPPADFLKRTIPVFQDETVGFVQTRWGHLNRDYSLLTRLQSLAIDAHFMVEQFARWRGGYWFNFNGSAGVWRRAAIEQAGGWQADTLTEDLDLSYRAFFKGWQGRFLRDVEVPAELPPSFSAYRRQQLRWARGSLECALKHLPAIWGGDLPLAKKLEASLHLFGYGVHLLLFGLAVLYPLVLVLSMQYGTLVSLFGLAVFFSLTTFAPTIFFLAGQKQLGKGWWRPLPGVLFLSAMGAGMMLNTVRALLQILRRVQIGFERTPKTGLTRRGESWLSGRYQIKLDPIVYYEFAFALFNLFTLIFAARLQNWFIAVYAAIFSLGLAFTSGVTIWQSLAIHRQNRRAARST